MWPLDSNNPYILRARYVYGLTLSKEYICIICIFNVLLLGITLECKNVDSLENRHPSISKHHFKNQVFVFLHFHEFLIKFLMLTGSC